MIRIQKENQFSEVGLETAEMLELQGKPLQGIKHDQHAQGYKEKHGNNEGRNEDMKRIK